MILFSLFIHLFISIFVFFVAVVVHAICVWSGGGTSCGKSRVIILLKMRNVEVGLDALTLR